VIYRPGKPGLILKNVKVPVKHLATGEITEIDVGGGIYMPVEHWEVIKKRLDRE